VGRAAPRRSVTGVISCCGNCCGRGLWRREVGVHPGRGGLGTNRSLPIFATPRGIGWHAICGCAKRAVGDGRRPFVDHAGAFEPVDTPDVIQGMLAFHAAWPSTGASPGVPWLPVPAVTGSSRRGRRPRAPTLGSGMTELRA